MWSFAWTRPLAAPDPWRFCGLHIVLGLTAISTESRHLPTKVLLNRFCPTFPSGRTGRLCVTFLGVLCWTLLVRRDQGGSDAHTDPDSLPLPAIHTQNATRSHRTRTGRACCPGIL